MLQRGTPLQHIVSKGCETISETGNIIKKYLTLLGRKAHIHTDGKVIEVWCVLEQTWKKNKTRFEDNSSEVGRFYRDYYNYIGPYDVDISVMQDDDFFEIGGEKYYLVRCEKVDVGGVIRYYRGVLKKGGADDESY